jgi:hypothetical protein
MATSSVCVKIMGVGAPAIYFLTLAHAFLNVIKLIFPQHPLFDYAAAK